LPQFYLSGQQQIPQEIVTSHAMADGALLEEALGAESGRKVVIKDKVRDARSRWLQMAEQNAQNNLRSFLAGKQTMAGRLESLRRALDLETIPTRMECFDISHSSGEATVASCVVFDGSGARKSDYRKFNIKDITAGDDYAAMQQALERRYKRLANGEGQLPDILFIDGGKGAGESGTAGAGYLRYLQCQSRRCGQRHHSQSGVRDAGRCRFWRRDAAQGRSSRAALDPADS
jgi:excinuclease ABC subunit C